MGGKDDVDASVRYESDNGIAIVTLDRPATRNAVDSATAAALVAAFERFDADETVDVAVLTDAGGTFCSGFDLGEIARGEVFHLEPDWRGPMGPTRMVLNKPVIAAIEGYAVAGGMELALWCDLRVAAGDAVLGFLNRRFGVPLIDLGTIRLPRLIGGSIAMDLILTGRQVNAVEAEAIGLVNRLAPSGEALGAAVALACELRAFPQTSLRNDRRSLIEQWGLSLEDAIANEARHGQNSLDDPAAIEGAQRFTAGDGRAGKFK